MFWQRFYDLCISVGSKPNPVGKKVGISSATITQWKQGAIPAGDNLAKIADFFDCSIDYLLGRTDNLTSHKTQGSTVNNAPISGNFNAVGSANTVTVNTQQLDKHQKLLIDLYNKLSPIEQIELINDLNTRLK